MKLYRLDLSEAELAIVVDALRVIGDLRAAVSKVEHALAASEIVKTKTVQLISPAGS